MPFVLTAAVLIADQISKLLVVALVPYENNRIFCGK